MVDKEVTRMKVLYSMSEEDRLMALGDEMYYGRFYAEKTEKGYRRLDPLKQTDEGIDGTEELHMRKTPGVMGMSHQAKIRDLYSDRD